MGQGLKLHEAGSIRLDSWKEIATFLRRDARTVRRWERERRLPVHRVPGGERSGVFAYTAELERWLHADVPVTGGVTASAVRQVAVLVAKTAVSNAEQADMDVDTEGKGELGEGMRVPGEASAASAECASAVPVASMSEVPLSALLAINRFDGPYNAIGPESGSAARADDAVELERKKRDAVPGQNPAAAGLLRGPGYQAVFLLVFIAIAAGVIGFVHQRELRRAALAVHQPTAEAQDLYLKGRYYWNQRTEEGLTTAVDLFTQSIVNDPKYAAAYAGLADCYLLLRQYGHMPNSEAYPRALAAARQAVALDDTSPDAHRSLGFIDRFWNWDMKAAETEYKRAIALSPNDSLSHHWYATSLLSAGRMQEALAQIDMARRLEPDSVSVLADRGLILGKIQARDGIGVLEQLEKAQPEFQSTHLYLSGLYLETGDFEGFLRESRVAAVAAHNAAAVASLDRASEVLARRGPRPMLRELAEGYAPLADSGAVAAYSEAKLLAMAGEDGRAIHYLRLSCDHREPGFLSVDGDRAFESIRTVPAFRNLLARRDVAVVSGREPMARLDRLKAF